MKKCILFFAAIWMTLCFCSCDDGRIYEKEVNIQIAAKNNIHFLDRKSTRLNSSHRIQSRMPSSA